jgi:hypothetical protein
MRRWCPRPLRAPHQDQGGNVDNRGHGGRDPLVCTNAQTLFWHSCLSKQSQKVVVTFIAGKSQDEIRDDHADP